MADYHRRHGDRWLFFSGTMLAIAGFLVGTHVDSLGYDAHLKNETTVKLTDAAESQQFAADKLEAAASDLASAMAELARRNNVTTTLSNARGSAPRSQSALTSRASANGRFLMIACETASITLKSIGESAHLPSKSTHEAPRLRRALAATPPPRPTFPMR